MQDICERVLLELAQSGALVAFIVVYTTYFDGILLEKASNRESGPRDCSCNAFQAALQTCSTMKSLGGQHDLDQSKNSRDRSKDRGGEHSGRREQAGLTTGLT